jgi:hypothetical protein
MRKQIRRTGSNATNALKPARARAVSRTGVGWRKRVKRHECSRDKFRLFFGGAEWNKPTRPTIQRMCEEFWTLPGLAALPNVLPTPCRADTVPYSSPSTGSSNGPSGPTSAAASGAFADNGRFSHAVARVRRPSILVQNLSVRSCFSSLTYQATRRPK